MTTPTHRPLVGKVALVTGGSRGIGAAIARRLASQGADVVIGYGNSTEKAEVLVKELTATGVRALAIKADQANAGQVTELVREAVARLGALDILVNNAGVFAMAMTGDGGDDYSALDQQLAVNIGGVVAAVREAAKIMRHGGRIITIGSNAADHIPFAGAAEYAGTKGAVAALSRGWARDLGGRNITVNTVQPGPIATDMNPDSGEFAETLKSMSALKRYGHPDEIAGVVAFLAGPDAAFITGSTLNVDGGINA